METLEINGIQYQVKKQSSKPRMSRHLSMVVQIAQMFSGFQGTRTSSGGKVEGYGMVEIVREVALIQKKKSNLTKSQRDWCEYQFNKVFEKVEI